MISSWTWDPLFPFLPTIVAAFLVATILLVMETRRRQRFRALRIGAQVIIVSALLMLLLRPSYPDDRTNGRTLLLTKNFNTTVVDSLAVADPLLKIIRAPNTNDYPGSISLQGIDDVVEVDGGLSMIAGEGVPAYLLPDIGSFLYFPPSAPNGVIALQLPRTVVAQRWNELHGVLHLDSGSAILRLEGPGGIEDSVRLTGIGDHPFHLSFFPKVKGKTRYDLAVLGQTDPLYLDVAQPRELAVLFVGDHPDFEQTYLKNYLAERGHRLAVRNRVSRDRFHFEFVNRPKLNLNRLTSAILEETDVLVIDPVSYEGLSAKERKAVVDAAADGLGILVLDATFGSSSKAITTLLPGASLVGEPDTVRFSLLREGDFTLPALPSKPKNDHVRLLANPSGRTLAGYVNRSTGKVGFQFLRETYRLGLEAKTDAYAAIWAPLLESVAREINDNAAVSISTPFPWYANEPLSFRVFSSTDGPDAYIDEIALPLIEDLQLDNIWDGTMWVEGNTWHTIMIDSTAYSFHDFQPGQWDAVRIATQIKLNKMHANGEPVVNDTAFYRQGILPIIFLLLFLIASGFLWLAPKV